MRRPFGNLDSHLVVTGRVTFPELPGGGNENWRLRIKRTAVKDCRTKARLN
jgi:hypothetical protein